MHSYAVCMINIIHASASSLAPSGRAREDKLVYIVR